MSEKHTPGRVKVQHPHAGERGWEVAFEPGLEQLCQDITEANARRLVACWNACEGITTERLEEIDRPLLMHLTGADRRAARMVKERRELLEALRPIAERGEISAKIITAARAAIAKVEGGAA